MNETLKVIEARYSCRAFLDRPVEREKLEKIALAAVQSPSAVNRQPWLINVITDKTLIGEMDAAGMTELAKADDKSTYERFMDRGGRLFYGAPVMILIQKLPCADLDCGIVTENVALAASSLGLGNVVCGMAAIPFGGKDGAVFKEKAGFADGYEFGMAVLVGYAETVGVPHEADMGKVKFIP